MESQVKENCEPSLDELHTKTVRDLNDALRCDHRGGKMLVTPGVTALGPDILPVIVAQIAAFDNFGPDNDPYEEHDFGSLMVGVEKIFWKIDYYDKLMSCGSPNPADPEVTMRVMTIFLASEY